MDIRIFYATLTQSFVVEINSEHRRILDDWQ
jgi:hypothetical protein